MTEPTGGTPEGGAPAGTPTGTPAGGGAPTDQAAREIGVRVDQLEKQNKDKDREIQELRAANGALETRLSSIAPAEPGGGQPAKPKGGGGGAPEAEVLDANQAAELAMRNIFLKDLRKKNNDLIEYGFEPKIHMRSQELIAEKGKAKGYVTQDEFEDCVNQAVKESRETVEKIKSGNQPPPSGAMGEGAPPVPATPAPVKKEPVLADEGTARFGMRSKIGL